jgi:hypothetical protein
MSVIKLLRSTTTGNTPTLSASGIVAINEADEYLFYRDSGATVRASALRGLKTVSALSSASVTINSDTTELHALTNLSSDVTYNAPTGTPKDGQSLTIRIKDDGLEQPITWNAAFTATQGVALPVSTNGVDVIYVRFLYNSSSTKWEAITGLSMS